MGIDFGTTNSVLAVQEQGGGARVLPFRFEKAALEAVRTTRSFRRSPQSREALFTEAGPWAIRDFLDLPEETRFLQSFKSFAAGASLTDTALFTRRHGFEKLMEAFLRVIVGQAGLAKLPQRLVIGRPVKFAGQTPDGTLAMRRYETALRSVGPSEIIYVLESVAAALFYAQTLTREAVLLIGDFGGGTSDFSVIRFKPGKEFSATALGPGAIGIAGDSFDYRIIENVVTPRLCKHASYVSWGKTLPVPIHYFASFARWNELCLMRRPEVLRELRELARTAKPKGQLDALIDLIEGGVGYDLYRIVGQAKAALSEHECTPFRYRAGSMDIEQTITRSEFTSWIAGDLSKISATVARVLTEAGLAPKDSDRVFPTGGTSYVPAVRKMFERRFSAEKIDTSEQLLSIARGLALIGASCRAQEWAAPI